MDGGGSLRMQNLINIEQNFSISNVCLTELSVGEFFRSSPWYV